MPDFLPVDHDPFAGADDDVPQRYPLASAPHAPPGVGPAALNAPLPNQNTFPDAPIADRAFGLNGVQRYQFFPERMVRGLASSVNDLMTHDPWDPMTGNLRTGAIEDSTDLAMGIAGSPMMAARPGVATLGSGAVRGARASEASALPMDEASRIARAQNMGFRTDMPVSYGTAPANERIAAAALNVEGRIYTGPTHLDAMMDAERSLKKPLDEMQHGPILDGFVTDNGRFVSRWEAGDIARRQSQGAPTGIFGATRGLASENTAQAAPLRDWFTADESGRQSFANQLERRYGPTPAAPDIGATAPGLPGGHGVWGSMESPAQKNVESLWHRADRPAVMDARGLEDAEIQASLRDAWVRGHDAVMLKNYTRPGAETPESIIVVRDASQLRSPKAAFDIAKKNSANLLAGVAGLAAFPVGSHLFAPIDHNPFDN